MLRKKRVNFRALKNFKIKITTSKKDIILNQGKSIIFGKAKKEI